MRFGSVLVMCILLLTTSLCACYASCSPGMDNSLAVYVTYPSDQYQVGSNLTVTVRVFREGGPFDPESVSLEVGWVWSSRDVLLSRASVGIFTGVFTIQMRDIMDGDVKISVTAVDGPSGDSATDVSWIAVDATEMFKIGFEKPTDIMRNYSPGETIDVSVRFTHDGVPVDPDDGSITFGVDAWGCEIDREDLVRVSTGVYEGSCTISPDCKENTRCDMWVYAEYTSDSGAIHYDEGRLELIVDFYILWAHLDKLSSDETRLDLWVLDLENSTVEDAYVAVNLSYEDSSSRDQESHWNGTTDGNGMVSVVLSHPHVHPTYNYLTIEGFVDHGGLRQTFFETLRAVPEDDDGISPEDTLAVMSLDEGTLAPSTEMELHFRAYSLGAPLEARPVYVYVHSLSDVHFNGVVETDGDGEFSVTIVTPPENTRGWRTFLTCDFQAQFESEWYSTSILHEVTICRMGEVDRFTDHGTEMTVETSKDGSTFDVTLDHPEADGIDEEAVVIWTLGDTAALEDLDSPEWTRFTAFGWGWWDIFDGYPVKCRWSSGAYHTSFDVPTFLTGDVPVFVMGLILLGPPDYITAPGGRTITGRTSRG